jgi:flagellin-specific chaperone FliS
LWQFFAAFKTHGSLNTTVILGADMNKTEQAIKQYDSLQKDKCDEKPLLKNDLIKALLVSTLHSLLEQSSSIDKENDQMRINNLLRSINIIHALKDFLYVGRETILADELALLSTYLNQSTVETKSDTNMSIVHYVRTILNELKHRSEVVPVVQYRNQFVVE